MAIPVLTAGRGSRRDVGSTQRDPSVRRPDHERVVLGAVLLAFLVLACVFSPPSAAALSLVLWVAFVPTARRLSDRFVLSFCAASGLAAVLLVMTAFTDVELDAETSRILSGAPGAAGLGLLIVQRGWRTLLPVVDGGLLPIGVTTFLASSLTIPPLVGRTPEALLTGLFRLGWDNQSHFSIFSTVYAFGGVWEPTESTSRPAFDDYPPLAGALWTLGTNLVYTGRTLPPESLIRPYAYASALMAAVSLAVLAWLATQLGELVLRPRIGTWVTRAAPAMAGTTVGAVLCFGPVLTFFDWGFSNFLLAVALIGAVSWLAPVHFAGRPARGAVVLAAGTAAVALLWTPLILILVPTGVVLVRRLLTQGRVASTALGLVTMSAAALVVLWQSQRLAPDADEAKGLAAAVASAGGGLPLLPMSQGLAVLAAGVVVTMLGSVSRRKIGLGILVPCTGALLLVGFFLSLALRSATAPQDSYYVVKAGWAFTLLAMPILGVLINMAVVSIADKVPVNTAAGRGQVSLVIIAVCGFFLSSLTHTTGQVGFFAVPSVIPSTLSRWEVFATVDEGERIFHASDRLASDAVPILWDGGGMKENRWLASLRGQLNEPEFNLYQSMRRAPYGADTVAVLREQLRNSPDMRVSIGYGKSATRSLLAPLVTEFPGRVHLVSLL